MHRLATTFADQAVIAIENARLFEEVQARNRDLTALGEVGRAVNSTLDLKLVLKTIADRAVALSGTEASLIFYFRRDTGRFELCETTGLDELAIETYRRLDIGETETGLGEAITTRQPVQSSDIRKRTCNPLRNAALEAGMRAALVVPLLGVEGPLGALVLQRRTPGEFPLAVINLVQSFADQSSRGIRTASVQPLGWHAKNSSARICSSLTQLGHRLRQHVAGMSSPFNVRAQRRQSRMPLLFPQKEHRGSWSTRRQSAPHFPRLRGREPLPFALSAAIALRRSAMSS